MTQASEQIAQQYARGAANYAAWKDILINVKDAAFGAKGNGTNDDAPAFRKAVSEVAKNGSGTLYIPQGTYLLSSMTVDNAQNLFVKLQSNMSIVGAGKGKTVIKVGNGPLGKNKGFQAVFGSFDGTLIQNLEVSGITFDLNGQNNLQIAGQEYFNGAVIARKANNIYVHDCEFKNCAGMQITAFGFDSNDDADNVRIKNNDYQDVSDTIPGNFSSDHSSIYVVGDNAWIEGNKFINSTRSSKATAIEADGKNHFIRGNYCYRYSIFVISASATAFIVDGQQISDNIARDILNGVMIYCSVEGNYRNVSIKNNIFQMADGTYANTERAGIDALTNVSAKIYDVMIENNQIYTTENYAALTNGYQSGILMRSAERLNINGNKFTNLGGTAIYLITLGATVESDEIEIKDNYIQDVGIKHASGYRSAITVQSLTRITNLVIDDNEIKNKDSSGILYGIEIQGKITGYIRRNDITAPNDLKTNFLTFGADTNIVIDHKTANGSVDYRDTICYKGSVIEVIAAGAYYGSTRFVRRIDGYFNKEYWGTAAPTTGYNIRGDRVFNTNTVELGTTPNKYYVYSWDCITDGEPGTWVENRVLTGN